MIQTVSVTVQCWFSYVSGT